MSECRYMGDGPRISGYVPVIFLNHEFFVPVDPFTRLGIGGLRLLVDVFRRHGRSARGVKDGLPRELAGLRTTALRLCLGFTGIVVFFLLAIRSLRVRPTVRPAGRQLAA